MNAVIFAVKRMAVHDGDGIRTTVFFKGCPLRCLWCHNPEGLSARPELSYFPEKCVLCGACGAVCPSHTVNGTHSFDRSSCIVCGKCEAVCPQEALQVQGKTVTVQELLPELLADRDFYEASGGGVTLSGGECLMQAPFCAELLKALKKQGIRTAVDTSGFVPRTALEQVLPYTDVFLYDVKAADSEVHRRCTGQPNERILENLRWLDSVGASIEVRIPYVPCHNDGEIPAIAQILTRLHHLTKVRLLPYHNFAGSKYTALGLPDTLPPQLPEKDALERAVSVLTAAGLNVLCSALE